MKELKNLNNKVFVDSGFIESQIYGYYQLLMVIALS